MSDALTALLRSVDALPASTPPLPCFIRDDDAGWDDARQLALCDATLAAGVPMDLAAIPAALGDTLVRELNARLEAHPSLLGVHQHGHTHTNHQVLGRKCEFGDARSSAQQLQDIAQGQARLQQAFGHRLSPLFTPPWNRCSAETPRLLAELGFAGLSRDRGALTQQAQSALPEIGVDVDWCKHQREGGSQAALADLARALQACAASGQPLGLMLHHAAMEQAEFDLLREVLAALSGHPRLSWHLMPQLLPAQALLN
ncbi:Polysaccharide deacetylase [Burkholderiales bacterium JOSHI_001]|nr:Polysaccharide deacetylase [Burkholderiales bacterium JOSHI_001]